MGIRRSHLLLFPPECPSDGEAEVSGGHLIHWQHGPDWLTSEKQSAAADQPGGPGKGQVCQRGSVQCSGPSGRCCQSAGKWSRRVPLASEGFSCRNRPISAFFLSTGFWGGSVASAEPLPLPLLSTPPTNQQRGLSSSLFFLSGRRFRGP